MAKRGRPNKYDEYVKPYLDKIPLMLQDKTQAQVANSLGVSHDSWCRYKKEYSELSEAVKKGEQNLNDELESTLIKRAKGFNYTEKKTIRYPDGTVREEIYNKASLPDVTAINLLLKNKNRENWKNDPAGYELRMKELELQERRLEMNEW